MVHVSREAQRSGDALSTSTVMDQDVAHRVLAQGQACPPAYERPYESGHMMLGERRRGQ